MKKGSVIWIVACAILVVILVIAAYFIYSQKKEMEDFKTQVEIENERKELEKEYADLAFQYDQYEGGKILLNNDSLVQKLDAEKMKVQRLLEELRTVKATDAARINELKKELATLEAIGMTKKQLYKLLSLEGIIYFVISLVLLTIIGIPLSKMIVSLFQNTLYYFKYHFSFL